MVVEQRQKQGRRTHSIRSQRCPRFWRFLASLRNVDCFHAWRTIWQEHSIPARSKGMMKPQQFWHWSEHSNVCSNDRRIHAPFYFPPNTFLYGPTSNADEAPKRMSCLSIFSTKWATCRLHFAFFYYTLPGMRLPKFAILYCILSKIYVSSTKLYHNCFFQNLWFFFAILQQMPLYMVIITAIVSNAFVPYFFNP
jgi:hypothetical protein